MPYPSWSRPLLPSSEPASAEPTICRTAFSKLFLLPSSLHLLFLKGLFWCPSFMVPCDDMRPTWITQDSLLFQDPWLSYILVISTQSLLPHKVMSTGSKDEEEIFGGRGFLLSSIVIKYEFGWKCTCKVWHITQKAFKELSGNAKQNFLPLSFACLYKQGFLDA